MLPARLFLMFCLCLISSYTFAQDYIYATGNPSFAVNIPVENGYINVANGNLHMEFSLATHKQRGALQLNERLVYDSRIWRILPPSSSNVYYGFFPSNIPNTPDTQGGWRFVTGAETGTVTNPTLISSSSTYCAQPAGGDGSYEQTVMSLAWSDPAGTVHPFDATLTSVIDNCGWYTNYSQIISPGYATDASGYYVKDDGNGNPLVIDNTGTQVYPQMIDRFGNYWSSDVNGNLIDDVGRTPVIVTTSGNVTYYDVLAPNGTINNNGTRVRYTVTTAPVTIFTHFNQSAVSEWAGTGYPVQSIQLPDGSSYSFTYDSYGEMTSITLPTGGVINYGWTNFQDSYQNMNRWLASRTVGSNPAATFTPSVISQCASNGTGCQEKVVVHKPSGDETSYELTLNNGAWNTKVSVYTGIASGTPVVTTAKAYSFQCSGCSSNYITKSSSVTTLPNGLQSQQQYVYDSPWLGKPSKLKEWDYFGGTAPTTPTRETDYIYNDFDLHQVTVFDNGVQAAQTTYDYTTSAATTPGFPQHGTVNAGGPYLQKVTQWLNTGTSPYTTYVMDDTGMVTSITDPKQNPLTTISYQCSNTLPLQTVNALGHTTTYGYDCNSGAITSVKDPNDAAANRSGTTYQYEATAGRLQTISYADGGQTTYSYPSPTEIDTTVTATPNPSISSQNIVDNLGRSYQHVQAGISTETTYDVNGRPYCTTNPHFTSSSSSTDGSTCITLYDGLDRPLAQTQSDGSSLTWSYSGNVTSSTDEAGHSWQRTSDAFGNLTKVVEPGNLVTNYSYNALGNLSTVTQNGATGEAPRNRSFSYDSLSRMITSNSPEAGATSYSYVNNGTLCAGDPSLPCSKTDARGVVTTYTYDTMNRLLSKTYSDATLSSCFQYDTPAFGPSTTGRMTKEWTQPGICAWVAQNPTNAQTYKQTLGYDGAGHSLGDLSCVVNCQGINPQFTLLKYWYDLAGHRTDLRDPSGTIFSTSYDNAGRISTVTNSTSQAGLFSASSYGPVGLLNSSLGNGLLETRSYDKRLRPITYSVSNPNAPVSSTPPGGSVAAPYNDANQTNVVAQGDTLHVQGWAASPTAGCPIANVEVDLGTAPGAGGTPIGNATLGLSGWRYDPGFTTCGFSFDDSVGDIAPGQYYVNVYGIDASGQKGLLQNQFPITVTDGVPPYGNVDGVWSATPNGGSVIVSGGKISLSGWAIDSQMISPVAAVKVWIDGNDVGFATLGVQRPDVVSIVGQGDSRYLNSGFTFTGTIGGLSPGTHSLGVTIYDAIGQHTTPASIYPITVTDDPSNVQGNLDWTNTSANGTISSGSSLTASGWAADLSADNCGVGETVEIWLGGKLIGQAQTSGSRPDVANAMGNPACANSGWSITGSIAGVPAGLHALYVRVYDAAGGSKTLNSVPQIMVTPQGSSTVLGSSQVPTKYSWSVGYAANGNIDYSYDSVNGNWAYLHDNLNRLASAGSSNGNALAWEYDSFGNMKSQTVTGGVGYSIQKTFAGNDNRMSSSCYDAAGNQLQDWGCYSPSQYTYDAEGRLASSGWGATNYIYDAEGRRVAKQSGGQTTSVYIYDDQEKNIAELDGAGGLIRQEVYAGDQHLATYNAGGSTPYYAFGDWVGTERARSDSNGNLCQTATSQPFGDNQQISGTCSPSRAFFTGLERDQESNLDHAQFRQYSSTMGRWMAPDPYLGSMNLANPQSLNRYSYVGNMPLSFTDPDGLSPEGGPSPKPTIGGCVGAVLSGGAYPVADINCVLHIFGSLFGGPSFNGSLTPRPSGAIWDENGGFSAKPYSSIASMIGDVGGLSTPGCEFGACGYLPQNGPGVTRASNDIGAWAGGYGLDALNWLLYTPGNREAPRRFFGTYWCGPGGRGPTGGTANGACAIHDHCFELAGINADGNTHPEIRWSLEQVVAASRCNQQLYDTMKASPDATGSQTLQLWLRYGDIFGILRRGTQVIP